MAIPGLVSSRPLYQDWEFSLHAALQAANSGWRSAFISGLSSRNHSWPLPREEGGELAQREWSSFADALHLRESPVAQQLDLGIR